MNSLIKIHVKLRTSYKYYHLAPTKKKRNRRPKRVSKHKKIRNELCTTVTECKYDVNTPMTTEKLLIL